MESIYQDTWCNLIDLTYITLNGNLKIHYFYCSQPPEVSQDALIPRDLIRIKHWKLTFYPTLFLSFYFYTSQAGLHTSKGERDRMSLPVMSSRSYVIQVHLRPVSVSEEEFRGLQSPSDFYFLLVTCTTSTMKGAHAHACRLTVSKS